MIIPLTSNALNSKREISIYYSRIAIIGLISLSYVNYDTLHLNCLDHGICIYGSLLNLINSIFIIIPFIFTIINYRLNVNLMLKSLLFIYIPEEIFNLVTLLSIDMFKS